MEIGSHGHSHKVLSLLDYKNQTLEITKSSKILSKITRKPIKYFCYPYGGKSVYNKNTKKILKKQKIIKAFDVESRKVNKIENPFEIPRFDCNDFPFGKAFLNRVKAKF